MKPEESAGCHQTPFCRWDLVTNVGMPPPQKKNCGHIKSAQISYMLEMLALD